MPDDEEPGMLIAAGGWCIPNETMYNLEARSYEIDWEYVDWSRVVDCYNNGYTPKPPPKKWYEMLPDIKVILGSFNRLTENVNWFFTEDGAADV